eukprot:gnl/MRDRNA2_/MRDRNA2_139917_c0_seq1.p1 gnl/MRDRNA2_/MRDRNA2_139917_c0~~gnl/MRDRNA2_/MRDRNA2_139917_c0_seq1.p1  ORF type:complete len:165 (-),score=38.19 gnl/MRDRNA2_/MRDRNA2_139917_c0_seq1:37-480(-)
MADPNLSLGGPLFQDGSFRSARCGGKVCTLVLLLLGLGFVLWIPAPWQDQEVPKAAISMPQKGTLKRWTDKGFGFIKPDDGPDDIFCHVSALVDGEGSVVEGDRVIFEVKFNEQKGKDQAANVQKEGAEGAGAAGEPGDDGSGDGEP